MLAPRPLEIFLLVVCAAGNICTGGEQELSSSQQLNQSDVEIILSAQTALRQYFIEALANLQEYITGLNPFYAVVNGILQGLRSRDLDPLKSFNNGYDSDSNQSAAYRMAAIVCSMQGCSSAQITLAEWHSFLQTIPHMTDILPPQPIIPHFTPRHLHKANADSFPDAALLLLQQNHLKLTNRLLNDVLYNYPFKNHSPDLAMAIDSFIRKLHPPIGAFRPEQTSARRPDEILSDIIRFLLQQRQDGLEFETAALISALSNRENIDHLRGESTPWELLELIRDDDYPPDVVRAARELAAAVKNNRINVDAGSLKGYSLLQKLLGLISQLAGIPSGDPLSGLVHGIYPHVKLQYLSSKGQFFHPQTSSDVAFLLNSFLTIPSTLLLGEVHKTFLLPQFNWRTILRNFDYSKYSKPRSLLMDMLQELLRNSNKLPTCDLILFSHFLSNYSKVPICSPYRFDDDIIGEKLGAAMKPLRLLPDLQKKSPPTVAPTPLPKCSNGPAVELVDPDSIIEILSKNATTLISDLIRFNPMPVDRYPNKTRAAVLRAVMNNLRTTGRNNSRVAESVIQQALMRVPLNEKANSPPRYLHLCPLEDNKVLISQDGQQQPVVHQERPTAASHGAAISDTPSEPASTTASSVLAFTATTTLQPSTFLSSVLARGSRPPSSPPAAVVVTALPITTASVTIAAVSSSSSTSDTNTIDSLSSSSSSDTTIAASPTAATALFSYFLKNASDVSPRSLQQPLPVYTAHQQFSSSFPDNPVSTPPQPPAVDSQPSSFPNSTL